MTTPIIPKETWENIQRRFQILYPEDRHRCLDRLKFSLGRFGVGENGRTATGPEWSEKDTILITYADMIHPIHDTPLEGLRRFLLTHCKGAIRTVHLLPFYPYSSDDGFSVIDYMQVDPGCGDWNTVQKIGEDFQLMFDLVLNHVSSKSSWFRNYMNGILPARDYFIEVDPSIDLSQVIRPRISPLLTATQTPSGEKLVWTTFSADQVDLNWSNPDVFFEFLDILLFYISQGAQIMRLDAVAFLWKTIGTSCIHLPQTHEVIKLYRDILTILAPQTILLTETNVPHEENLSYFGQGDEAHMVYQFSLPPLTLHALLAGSATWLTEWASSLPELPAGQCFFNFTASHDGIGVRPLQGLLPDSEIRFLVQEIQGRGGHVSCRTASDGTQTPYELNITYFSALSANDRTPSGSARFLASQWIAMSLRGIPGIYFHSLTATPNDHEGVRLSGAPRSINRHKYQEAELECWLSEAGSHQKFVFDSMLTVLRRRSERPAFHPEATQKILDLDPKLFTTLRTSIDGQECVLCVHHISREPMALEWARLLETAPGYILKKELIQGISLEVTDTNASCVFEPYECRWLWFCKE
jgi:glycosidase